MQRLYHWIQVDWERWAFPNARPQETINVASNA